MITKDKNPPLSTINNGSYAMAARPIKSGIALYNDPVLNKFIRNIWNSVMRIFMLTKDCVRT